MEFANLMDMILEKDECMVTLYKDDKTVVHTKLKGIEVMEHQDCFEIIDERDTCLTVRKNDLFTEISNNTFCTGSLIITI